MTGPDQPEEAPAPDEVLGGDQEATWLITAPPPPPPPIGAPLPAPEQARPTPPSPPPPLPTASTPRVNAPRAEKLGPAPGEVPGPARQAAPPAPKAAPPAGDTLGSPAAPGDTLAWPAGDTLGPPGDTLAPPPVGDTLDPPPAPVGGGPLPGSPEAETAQMPDATATLPSPEVSAASVTPGPVPGVTPAGEPSAPGAPPVGGEAVAPGGPPIGEPAVPPTGIPADAQASPEPAASDAAAAGDPSTPPGPAAGGALGAAAGGEAPGGANRHTSHRLPFAGGSAAAKSALREVSEISAWMLASAAILLAFVVAWFAGILLSFRHSVGLTARDRILQFFEPGTLGWAVAVLVAIALFEAGRRSDPILPADPTDTLSGARLRKKRFADLLPFGLFLAAAAVTVSALVAVLVELSNFGNGIDTAFSALINNLALVAVGSAATWLAVKETGKTSP